MTGDQSDITGKPYTQQDEIAYLKEVISEQRNSMGEMYKNINSFIAEIAALKRKLAVAERAFQIISKCYNAAELCENKLHYTDSCLGRFCGECIVKTAQFKAEKEIPK